MAQKKFDGQRRRRGGCPRISLGPERYEGPARPKGRRRGRRPTRPRAGRRRGRPKKAEGAKKPRGAPTSEYHGVSRLPRRRTRGRPARQTPVSLGGDGKYKSIGLFPTEKAAMAVDDYPLYKAREVRLPRNFHAQRHDGTCDVLGVPGPPPGGPPL